MPRGGRRSGKPGKAYSNRSDLSTSKVAEYTGQTYGTRKAQVDAQKAVPVAPPPTSNVPGPPAAAPSPGPAPGTLGDLLGPSVRPDEPLSAGAPFGAGPGPDSLARLDPDVAAIDRLRMLARSSGSPSLLRLLESWEDGD